MPEPTSVRTSLAAPITPMPVPAGGDVPLIVLIGGTFDPPHRAHIELPIRARDALELQAGCPGKAWLLYVPVARSPHKGSGPIASDTDRTAMLRLALKGRERVGVWTDETDRAALYPGAPSYSVDTLARARQWLDANGFSGCSMRLLIGADQAMTFDRWHEPRRIIALAGPAVMLRPPLATRERLMEALRAGGTWSADELRQWGSRLVEVGTIDAAATSVRALLAAGANDRGVLKQYLDDRVLDYITSRRLYALAGSPPAGAPPRSPAPG